MTASEPPHQTPIETLSAFIEALTSLQTASRMANPDGRSLQQQFLALQQRYQQQLIPMLADMPAASALTPYQTEISRALRLLGMDISFLQSAKNSATQQKRQSQMQQRLTSLLEFSQGLKAEVVNEPARNSSDLPRPGETE